MFKVVEIKPCSSSISSNRHEKSDQKENHGHDKEGNRVAKSAPESLSEGIPVLLFSKLVIFLVPEVRERNNEQAEDGIKRVKRVIDDRERLHDTGNGIRSCPILPLAQFARVGR